VKGIQVVIKGEEVLIGDNPQEFATQVARVLSGNALYKRIASKSAKSSHGILRLEGRWRSVK